MGGYFGAVNRTDAISDVFFGTDYHSHLGTKRAGMAAYDSEIGLQREIHNISNSPFRTRFEHIFEEMRGTAAIGCISDSDPQPLLICSNLGKYAICVIGVINNADALIEKYLRENGGHFNAMTGGKVNGTELVAALIDQKKSFVEGLLFAQGVIEGSASILVLRDGGTIIAARDRLGRTPILVGKSEEGYCVAFEAFAYQKLGYVDERELGPGEIVEISADGLVELAPPRKEMRICAFLWSYYGFPTATYEGVNVEVMRYRNGRIMAENDALLGNNEGIDYVCGVPDSGTPHAIGYANESGIPFARPYIKYTPTWSRITLEGLAIPKKDFIPFSMLSPKPFILSIIQSFAFLMPSQTPENHSPILPKTSLIACTPSPNLSLNQLPSFAKTSLIPFQMPTNIFPIPSINEPKIWGKLVTIPQTTLIRPPIILGKLDKSELIKRLIMVGKASTMP